MIPWEDNFGALSKNQEELIIGSLLGDARLECRSLKETARLRIHHADSQKDYLFWKFKQLENLTACSPRRHEYVDKRNGKQVISWYFHTRTLASLGKLHSLFYKLGRKVVPVNLIGLLTPLALSVWIMDDGCFYRDYLILNTQSFSLDEQRDLQTIFKKKFLLDVGIQKDRRNFRLYFSRKATVALRSIVPGFPTNQSLSP